MHNANGDKWAKFDKKHQKKPGNLAYVAKKHYSCQNGEKLLAKMIIFVKILCMWEILCTFARKSRRRRKEGCG